MGSSSSESPVECTFMDSRSTPAFSPMSLTVNCVFGMLAAQLTSNAIVAPLFILMTAEERSSTSKYPSRLGTPQSPSPFLLGPSFA